ncbi:hypothetical protein LINPERHAP1_LOCUS22071 [Linum perenne]
MIRYLIYKGVALQHIVVYRRHLQIINRFL